VGRLDGAVDDVEQVGADRVELYASRSRAVNAATVTSRIPSSRSAAIRAYGVGVVLFSARTSL
jgi:hypothetical protein